jgi:hypothetical protein
MPRSLIGWSFLIRGVAEKSIGTVAMKNGDKISILAAPPQAHEVLEGLPDTLENLYLTFVTPDGTVTFARDDAQDFKVWMLVQCAKLYNDERGWNALFMIKREFTHLKDAANGLPVKKLSSCRLEKNGSVTGMTADETRSCYQVDAKTGRPIKPPPDVVFVDFGA